MPHKNMPVPETNANVSSDVPNVIIFGETGAGKSSLVNMLEGEMGDHINDRAVGRTFSNIPYGKTIHDKQFRVFDTVGLNEASRWSDEPRDVGKGLRELINKLTGGVHLLVHVVRGRVTETTQENYNMFFKALCQQKTPIVIVVTFLEEREDMDSWWEENQRTFDQYGMKFSGHACITASRGKFKNGQYSYEGEYQTSKDKVQDLIYSSHNLTASRMPPQSRFEATMSLILTKMSRPPETRRAANVIVFGETGAGKSSVVNMLEGDEKALVSDQAAGVTFNNTPYDKTIFGAAFRVFDTVGLNEGSGGTVTARAAVEGLYELICQLDDGVSLLVYVMRAPRIRNTAKKNYEMFCNVFCQRKVPIVIVITGLETRADMDAWWDENKHMFEMEGMRFGGHACITATKGPFKDGKHVYEHEYEESKWQVQTLAYDLHSQSPWKMPPTTWLESVLVRAHNIFAVLLGLDVVAVAKELQIALQKYAGLTKQEAVEQANKMEMNRRRRERVG